MIRIKRAYEKPDPADGLRILVDRLWPRGLAKESAKINHWLKDIAPSHDLRKWFGHDPEKWPDFKNRYFEELKPKHQLVKELIVSSEREAITLVYGAKNDKFNNAIALKEFMEMSLSDDSVVKKRRKTQGQ